MANVIIKNEERKNQTDAVLRAYGVNGQPTAIQREAAEHIVVRSMEVHKELQRMGGHK